MGRRQAKSYDSYLATKERNDVSTEDMEMRKGRKGKRILHDLRLLVKSMDVELQIQRGDCGT